MYGPPAIGSTLTGARCRIGRQRCAPGALPSSLPTTRTAIGVGPAELPKSPIRLTVCASSRSSGGKRIAQVGVATVPSLRITWKSRDGSLRPRMNQLKVTGMLSSSLAPLGQPTASSVPHEALRIFGTGRWSGPAAPAVPGSAPSTAASASASASASNGGGLDALPLIGDDTISRPPSEGA
ncbi:MAG: hypothetical protein JWO14_2168 [Solirubrobacterales bacterium]|nr:hypothetical protein [Solirubrobacterales bacterium]